MAITIRDVSKRCGLSVSAVSKALNNYPDVSDETRKKVLKAAKEIGYHPNALARGLKTNRTYNLGVILDDELHISLLHNYFITILNGFRMQAEARGYDITLVNHNIGGETLSYLDHARYRNIDGVCLMCVNFLQEEIVSLVQSGLPIVTIDHVFEGKECVLSDNRAGMHEIVDYAVEMGHRKIGFIHGTLSYVTDERLTAFYEAVGRHGLAILPSYVMPSHYHSTAHAKRDTLAMLSQPDPPTCLLMADDYSALGGMEAIGEMGLRVPEDISIVGYDGITLIQKIRPRLTTVWQNSEEMGKQAAKRLIDRIEAPQAPVAPPTVVAGNLLRGETVRRIG